MALILIAAFAATFLAVWLPWKLASKAVTSLRGWLRTRRRRMGRPEWRRSALSRRVLG